MIKGNSRLTYRGTEAGLPTISAILNGNRSEIILKPD